MKKYPLPNSVMYSQTFAKNISNNKKQVSIKLHLPDLEKPRLIKSMSKGMLKAIKFEKDAFTKVRKEALAARALQYRKFVKTRYIRRAN